MGHAKKQETRNNSTVHITAWREEKFATYGRKATQYVRSLKHQAKRIYAKNYYDFLLNEAFGHAAKEPSYDREQLSYIGSSGCQHDSFFNSPERLTVMTNIEKASTLCRVSIRGRRSFTLRNFVLADRQYVAGIMEDGTYTRIQLRDGVKVVALASDCDGQLVSFPHRCTCNESQARVHDVAQQPTVPPVPAVILKGRANNFAALRQIWSN